MTNDFQDIGKNSTDELLRSILDTAFYGIMTFESVRNKAGELIDFKWVFVNDVAELILQQSADDLIGKRLLQEIPKSIEDELFLKYKEVVETGETIIFEHAYSWQKTQKWFKISAVKLGDGFTVSLYDITELKESILLAENKEKKYQKIFEESMDAIFLVDENFTLIDANHAFINLFNYKLESTNLSLPQLFFQQEDFSKLQNNLQSVQLLIQDNGMGISKEKMNKIFEPFYSEKSAGNGLGLTTVQNIIHAHDAQIALESELNVGTTFQIYFSVGDR